MFTVDEIKLGDALHKRADDPIFSAGVYYGVDSIPHLTPMQNKVRQYTKAYLQMLSELPGRQVDYDWAVGAAIDFIKQERTNTVKVDGTKVFKEEWPHTAFVYLVEAARAYISPVHRNDVKTLVGLALKELYPEHDADAA